MCPRGRCRHRAWFGELPHGQALPSEPSAVVMVPVASAVLCVDAFFNAVM
jgi:hypothetical protein